jgi:hypothetical protein
MGVAIWLLHTTALLNHIWWTFMRQPFAVHTKTCACRVIAVSDGGAILSCQHNGYFSSEHRQKQWQAIKIQMQMYSCAGRATIIAAYIQITPHLPVNIGDVCLRAARV